MENHIRIFENVKINLYTYKIFEKLIFWIFIPCFTFFALVVIGLFSLFYFENDKFIQLFNIFNHLFELNKFV